MKKYNLHLSGLFLVLVAALSSCKKGPYDVITPPAQATFANQTTGTYYVKNDPNTTYKIPVGFTTASSSARTITVSVASSTNAAAGTQYTLPSTTVTIPAGKVVDSLTVKGIFAGYTGSRVDTLTFTITGGDGATPSDYNKTYKLVMRRYCDVVAANLIGNYANSRDYDGSLAGTPSGLKYTGVISDWTPVTATTATIKIKNLGGTVDIGFLPFAASDPATTGLTATVDWTDPANFKITIPSQNYVASLYTYGQSTISGTGTFSSCDQTFTFSTVVRVAAGSFSTVVSQFVR